MSPAGCPQEKLQASNHTPSRRTGSGGTDHVSPKATPVELKPADAAEPRKAVLPFSLEMNPPSARAKLDYRNVICTTPCNLKLPEGMYTVSVSAPGYVSADQVFDVPGTGNLAVTLQKKVKAYAVNSTPSNLGVWVDDEQKGRTPVNLKLELGTHRLRVEGNGFSETRTITVDEEDPEQTPLNFGPGHAPKGELKPDDAETPERSAK